MHATVRHTSKMLSKPKMTVHSFLLVTTLAVRLACFLPNVKGEFMMTSTTEEITREVSEMTTTLTTVHTTDRMVPQSTESQTSEIGTVEEFYDATTEKENTVGEGTEEVGGAKRTLNAITWVGSLLSVAGLVLCILTFILIKKLREKQPTKIHVNLCLCLIGFYISFLTGDVASRYEAACKNTAVAIKYFSLSTVGWMAVEAINMYFLFVKFERMSIMHFIPVSCVLVYGYPMIPVLAEVFLTSEEDYGCCFLPPSDSGHFYVFLCTILVMVMFNLVAFLLVIRRVVCRRMMTSNLQQGRRKELVARIQQFGLFWVLLGPSWIFGFLSILPDRNITVSGILFCICTSLQGFVLFIFICARNPEVRKLFDRNQSTEMDGQEMNKKEERLQA